MKPKPSELFEGKNSSLYKTFMNEIKGTYKGKPLDEMTKEELIENSQKDIKSGYLGEEGDDVLVYTTNQTNYISHTHCWDNPKNPCGIKIEKHTQCCLCDMKYNNRIREEWEEEFQKELCEKQDYNGVDLFYWRNWHTNNLNLIPTPNEVKNFIDELLKSQRDSIVERIEKAMPSHDAVQKVLSLIKEQ